MEQDKTFYLEKVKEQLTEPRYQHTLGVMETAVKLAERYGADTHKAELAAILHDYCKYWKQDKLEQIILETPHIPDDLIDYGVELWHAPAGAEVVKRDLNVTDEEVLDAIRYHTSGRAGMTLLDKVIWMADYIEPGRDFPGVDEVRKLAESDLDQAMLRALDNTIMFLIQKGKKIYPRTLAARNDLIK
ncbi:MAG: bis(5'-nucleosyl)-tetraphosphatase (symmetrical) YqeK [Bacillaceae bacterium]|nr:bis(5'-nucleosyl)-tetraphosphatase (symmetrical) YqeK [Bacillaceae bacterium]